MILNYLKRFLREEMPPFAALKYIVDIQVAVFVSPAVPTRGSVVGESGIIFQARVVPEARGARDGAKFVLELQDIYLCSII